MFKNTKIYFFYLEKGLTFANVILNTIFLP